jgi:hypothetical protein
MADPGIAAAALLRLQPALPMPEMPNMRSCLSGDLNEAIRKLDYLGMSVGEALCLYHNVHSLQEVATLDEKEQDTMFDVVAAVAGLLHWRKAALRDEMHRLFASAKVCAVDTTAQCDIPSLHTLANATSGVMEHAHVAEGQVGAHGMIHPLDSLSVNDDVLGPHWQQLEVHETDTAVIKSIAHVKAAFDLDLIAGDILNMVLLALWESSCLAAASTDCAAKALLVMQGVPIPESVKYPKTQGYKNKKKKSATNLPVQIPDNQVEQHARHHKETESPAAAAVKAAKKALRDMFKWRAFGEMCGMDSKASFTQIVKRQPLDVNTMAQLGNGFRHTRKSRNMAKLKETDGSGEFEKCLGFESSSTACGAPPGLEL